MRLLRCCYITSPVCLRTGIVLQLVLFFYPVSPGPCPNARIKDVTPVTTTTRGADFPVRWFKNNHLGGFVRWTLVPVHLAQSHEAHDEGAFEWGCFSAGHLKCTPADKEEHCGGDLTGSAFHATVRVPTNIADGEYMLGWSWFGGYALQPPTGTLEPFWWLLRLSFCRQQDVGQCQNRLASMLRQWRLLHSDSY